MSKILLIGISKSRGDVIKSMKSVEAIQGKGLIDDRKFKDNNNKKSQITLIEMENINYYNKTTNSSIKPLDFRRNLVTEGIKLNELINKEFLIGKIKVKAHDLCKPCKYLQKLLNKDNIIDKMNLMAGLRCEILTSGKIFVNDIIRTYD